MNPSRNAAFTLLELLVAVTITLILAGLMLAVVINTLNLWQRTQDDFTRSSQAIIALDLIERDLHAAIFRTDGGHWLAADVSNSPASLAFHGWLIQPTMKPSGEESRRLLPLAGAGMPPSIGDARFGLSGVWLRFVTTNRETDGSLPVAVSYQIARRPVSGVIHSSNPAEVRYTLFRSAVTAAGTFSNGTDVNSTGYSSNSVTPAATRNPKTLMNPNSVDALATNVVDFGVWLYVREPATGQLRRVFPADEDDLVHAAASGGTSADATRFPEVVDIMIRILSDQGAALLAEIETEGRHLTRPPAFASDAEWWWGVVEAHSRVHVRRIVVRGTSP